MNMNRTLLIGCLLALGACSSNESGRRPAASVESERSSGGEHHQSARAIRNEQRANDPAADARVAPAQAEQPNLERSNNTIVAPPASDGTAVAREPISPGLAADDTGVNQRDRSGRTLTSGDQKENATDLEVTRRVRAAVVGDSNLSFNAKNVKIVTQNGRVTLRGPVGSAAERTAIIGHASQVVGPNQVNSELEVTK
jgi:hyperosmotically inducible protein